MLKSYKSMKSYYNEDYIKEYNYCYFYNGDIYDNDIEKILKAKKSCVKDKLIISV